MASFVDLIRGLVDDGEELKASARFRLGKLIAKGGMGVVYEAEQIGAYGFAKKVALKLIEPSTSGQAEVVKAFIGEARLVARLVHPNIAQVYNLGRTSNHIFIVMELVHGLNCQELLARLASQGARLTPAAASPSRPCRTLRCWTAALTPSCATSCAARWNAIPSNDSPVPRL
ncbi:MAG: hypothetical protein EB141_01190 [Verrucomicrobia bacterium]|nr:hypothetical protein [Verrucomicrobiota bacterium]